MKKGLIIVGLFLILSLSVFVNAQEINTISSNENIFLLVQTNTSTKTSCLDSTECFVVSYRYGERFENKNFTSSFAGMIHVINILRDNSLSKEEFDNILLYGFPEILNIFNLVDPTYKPDRTYTTYEVLNNYSIQQVYTENTKIDEITLTTYSVNKGGGVIMAWYSANDNLIVIFDTSHGNFADAALGIWLQKHPSNLNLFFNEEDSEIVKVISSEKSSLWRRVIEWFRNLFGPQNPKPIEQIVNYKP